ncbi:MAG: hypothetical protein HY053_00755 [Proteobacteria bacterium]|nr:hypothetical protein [Pseudomonadota bacterium]
MAAMGRHDCFVTTAAELSGALNWDNELLKDYLQHPHSTAYDGHSTRYVRTSEHKLGAEGLFGAVIKLPNIEDPYGPQFGVISGIDKKHFVMPKALSQQLHLLEAARQIARLGQPEENVISRASLQLQRERKALRFIEARPEFFPDLTRVNAAAYRTFLHVFSYMTYSGGLALESGEHGLEEICKKESLYLKNLLVRYGEEYGLGTTDIIKLKGFAQKNPGSVARTVRRLLLEIPKQLSGDERRYVELLAHGFRILTPSLIDLPKSFPAPLPLLG